MTETAPTYNKLETTSSPEAIAEPATIATSTIATPLDPNSTSTAPPNLASDIETLTKPSTAAVASEGTLALGPTSTSALLTSEDLKNDDNSKIMEIDMKDTKVIEPQNTLTRQFTEREWAALKDFRARLPEIFAEGFPDDPNASEKVITFWGVNIDPKSPAADARVSVVLMKFLRARNLDVHEARDMFMSTLRWRTSIDIDAVLKEEFPEDVFGNVGHIFGYDRGGRPVVYNIYGGDNLAEVFSDTNRFIRWRVALQEKTIALLDFTETDQTVQIHGTTTLLVLLVSRRL
ncbi:hypothetical protein H2248_010715 [Termitomyces sp. 'cryptogamus']|nr:hypothetical protein H2248_010715 [Termitomyces sp. 'cryptogamus']